MKVREEQLGNSKPKLSVEDLGGGDFVCLQVASYEEVSVDGDEGKRLVPVLTFQETGDKTLWLNKTQVGYLVTRLGDESDDWMGQYVPVEQVTKDFGGKRFAKLWIMAPEEWDEALVEFGVAKPKAKKTVAAGVQPKPVKRRGRAKR